MHIFGYLKCHKSLDRCLNSDHPNISEEIFKSYDWFDFYRDTEESIPAVMPEPRGSHMTSSLFVDADLAGDKRNRHN